jgi:DNA-binding transcriptional regulator YiaG
MALKKFTDSEVGEKIKEVRETLGLTQEAFAAKVKCDQSTVTDWENKGRVPHAIIIRQIALRRVAAH